jgi:UDP-N-acetylglucosamine--N-acetylmuramyl-(pentapeptide) pyrophosphoryl-undecaprenol N-acetylglucosamine transferase
VVPLIKEHYAELAGAADLVITRAGATALAEFAAVEACAIIIPSPYLAGDHQTKNARIYEQAEAAVILDQKQLEHHPEQLGQAVESLLENPARCAKLARNLAKFARPDALDQMTKMILTAVTQTKQRSKTR